MEGGNSLEQAVALVAAANRVVQDPSSVGSALRTISLRLRGTSVEILEEMGEETDGVVESTSKLQEKIQALSGVNILTEAGEYKDTYTILREIGNVWEDMSDIDQAALLELMAGKNRANTLSAILSNMTDLKGAYESALSAEGSALKENEAYLDSIQGRIDLFNNAVQTMWMNFISSDAVKFIVDLGTGFIGLIDNLGVIETLLIGVVGYLTLFKNFDWTGKANFAFGNKGKIKLLKGDALDAEIDAFNAALAQGADAFANYKLQSEQAGNGMNILAEKVSNGTIQLKNGKVASQDYAAALQNQSKAAMQAANKQKIMNVAFALTTMAVSSIISAIQSYADSIQTTEERYEELQSNISSAENDINSFASKIQNVQEQIDNLSGKSLSITEAEELRKLKEESAELQRQKDIRENMLKAYKTQDEAASLAMFNQAIKTTAANQKQAAETGKAWGKVLGFIGDAALIAGGAVVTGLSGGLATAIGATMIGAGMSGAASSILPSVGEWAGSQSKQVEEDLTAWYQSYTEAIEEANEQAVKAESEYLSNVTDSNYEKWQKKLDASNKLQQEFYSNLESLQGYIDNLEYNDVTKSTIDGFNNLMTQISLQGVGDNIQSKISYIQDLENEFAELSKGVDENGKNIALSTEEYTRYQSILSQILGITPSLVKGYNDENNAIVNKNSLIAESIELLKKQQKIEAQKLTSDENILTTYKSSNDNYQTQLDVAKEVQLPSELSYSGRKKDKNGKERTGYVNQIDSYIADIIGVEKKASQSLQEYVVANADAIYANLDKIIERSKQDKDGWLGLTDEQSMSLLSWLESIRINIEYAEGSMADFKRTLSIVAQGSDYYNNLSGSHINFIDSYIDSFGDLSDLSDEEVLEIRNNIRSLTDKIGQDKDLQELINDIFEVNPEIAAKDYIASIDNILQKLVDGKVISEEVKTKMLEQFAPDKENVDKMISEVQRALGDDYDEMAQRLSVSELKIAYKFVAGKADGSVTANELQAELEKNAPKQIIEVQSYVDLSERTSSYNDILAQTNAISADNIKVTQEYKTALQELGLAEEEIGECFDENNSLVVTNSQRLRELVAEKKKAIASDVKLAKAQSQLEYYDLVDQLRETINVTGDLANENRDAAHSLLDQIDAVKNSIIQYQMLEDSLLGATSAFEKFAAAKEIDAQNTYGDSYVEMAQSMYDALYKTGEVGTEQFWTAAGSLVPDSVYKHLESGDAQVQAIYDYFNKNVLPTMTLKDDQLSLDYDAIENFVEEAQAAGVFTDTGTKSFKLSQEFIDSIEDGENGLKKFAEAMGMTETQAYAMLAEFDKYNTDDSELPMISQLDKTTVGKVTKVTNELERLNEQKLALLEDGGYEKHGKELEEINKQIEEQTKNYDELQESSYSAWQNYTQTDAAISALQEVEDKTTKLSKEQAIKLGVEWKEGMSVEDALKQLEERKAQLEQPTTLTAQLARDHIQDEIDAIEQELESSDVDIEANIKLNDDGYYEVVGDVNSEQLQTLASLYNEQMSIETFLNTGLTTAETFLSSIESILSEINGKIPENNTGSGESEQTDGAPKKLKKKVPVKRSSDTDSDGETKPLLVKRKVITGPESGFTHGESYVDSSTISKKDLLGTPVYVDPDGVKRGVGVGHSFGDATLEVDNATIDTPTVDVHSTTDSLLTNGPESGFTHGPSYEDLATIPGPTPAPMPEPTPTPTAEIITDKVEINGGDEDKGGKEGTIDYLALRKEMASGNYIPYSELPTVGAAQPYEDQSTLSGPVENAVTAINSFADATQNGAAEIKESTVDLENRPVIDSTTMQQAGWEDFEEGSYATVYSSAYSNEDESKTIVLTPILPDGQVLTPEQLQDYANRLLSGEELDPGINIKLAEFDGEDTIQKANEYAAALHESQAALIDPLGIHDMETDIVSFMDSLDALNVQYKGTVGAWFDGKTDLTINVPDLVSSLSDKGWTDGAIQSYIQQLSTDLEFEGFNIKLDGIENVEAVTEATGNIPEEEETQYKVTGDGLSTVQSINSEMANIPATKTSHINIYETTHKRTVGGLLSNLFGFGAADGTAHVNGTAYANGNFGAPKTEEALGGELGPEMRVRNGRWELIGQHGAEFFDVKKGDIIFNHKQTEDLLKNGYVTGRGKAYAGGTVGGAAYSGLWKPTSPDKNLSNTAGSEIGDAAGKLSKAAKDISKSGDELSEDFKEIFDWIEVRIEEITEDIDLKNAKLENAVGSSKQNAIIDDMIGLNQNLYDNLTAGASKYYAYAAKLLQNVPAAYREAAKDGSIAIESFVGTVGDKTLTAIQDYREWVQKGADATQQAEETLTEIANLAKQAIDNIAQEYENKSSIPTIKIEQLEAYNSLIETTVSAESAKVYEAIIKENNKNIKILAEQRNKMQSELNTQVEAGNIKKYSQAWYDAINDIAAVDTEIIELTTDTENYQDSINELHWDHFDNIISRLEAVSDETDNLIDILSSKDLVNKDTAEWTDEGITALGLYAQQMETAEVQAKKYKEEINYLNKNWKKLGYTEQEYVEKLEELKNGQYDAIKSYNDTKKAIKDLTSERVDAIKKGIEKEIEAYEELINKKKEELDAEKDLHDFQRGVADQQKEIADIERKLAALSADNSASARAQRAQLQAELAKAQQELQDTYYDRSISDQQEALDKELENFREEKDKEMEGWDAYLENTEQVVSDALTTVQSNTEIVYQTLQNMGQEYSLSMSTAITSPWEDGVDALQNYSEKFKLTMSSTVEELQKLSEEYKKVMAEIDSAGKEAVGQVNENVKTYQNDSKTQSNNNDDKNKKEQQTIKVGGKVNAGGAKIYDYVGDKTGVKQYYTKDPIYTVLKIDGNWVQVRHKSLKSGVTGWFKKSDIKAYAQGTTGVTNNQLAWIDELGEELVIRPSNGRMTFLEKGTGVVPADLTSNLMEWGELDPSVMLERNKPEIKLHPEVHNTEVNITMDIAEVVHVDRVDNENMPDLTKAVEKQLDKYMKNLNNQIRRHVR